MFGYPSVDLWPCSLYSYMARLVLLEEAVNAEQMLERVQSAE